MIESRQKSSRPKLAPFVAIPVAKPRPTHRYDTLRALSRLNASPWFDGAADLDSDNQPVKLESLVMR